MPLSCAAFNCVVRHEKGSGVKFHRFPKNEDLLRKWVKAINRKDYKPSGTAVICSKHFKAEDYYINPYGTRVLKKEVVPSIFSLLKRPKKVTSGTVLIKNGTVDKLPPLPVTTVVSSTATCNDGSREQNAGEQENNISSSCRVSQIVVEDIPTITTRHESLTFNSDKLPTSTVSIVVGSGATSNYGSTEQNAEEQETDISSAWQEFQMEVEDVPTITISHESFTFNSNIRKRKRSEPVYVGDFEESDLESPRKRQKYWNVSQSVIQKYRKDNKYLRCKLQRSYKKITYLNRLLEDLKKVSTTP